MKKMCPSSYFCGLEQLPKHSKRFKSLEYMELVHVPAPGCGVREGERDAAGFSLHLKEERSKNKQCSKIAVLIR